MPLTVLQIAALQPLDKSYRKADEKGLYLEVFPNGSKLWRFKYRIGGKEKRLALGAYPETTLIEARERRDTHRKQVKDGIDPAREKRLDRLERKVNAGHTFGEIAADYIRVKYESEGKAKATVDKQYFFMSHLIPTLGNTPLGEIKPVELMAALRKLEAKGHRQTAKCTRAFASRVFRYGVGIGKCNDDPARLLSGNLSAPKVKHMAAILDPKRVGEFLRAADAYHGQAIVQIAVQLHPHLMLRQGELRGGHWHEIDFDKSVWLIPAERTKMRRESHAVPLSAQAIALLRELERHSGGLEWMFRGQGKKGPISENTLNQAYKRMGFGSDEVTPHGFRTTASTFLNETGKWNKDAIEKALAHKDADAIRAIYNRGTYWSERVQMMQWWSDYLDTLKTGATVLPFDVRAVPA
jgi:integrase